jgi:hypothetical protein
MGILNLQFSYHVFCAGSNWLKMPGYEHCSLSMEVDSMLLLIPKVNYPSGDR